jgi:hypothetical protein
MNRWLCSLLLLGLFPFAASAQTVSVVPSATTYVATGGTASFTVTLTYPGVVTALGFQFGSVPAGWSFVSAGGNNPPGIVPAAGTPGVFEFAYTSIPASPITFTITAAYPAGLVGNQIFSGVIGTLRPGPVSVNGANVVLSPSTAVGAPAITRQPVGAVLTQGDNYLLTVEASGAAPLTYQWRKDAVPVAGATTASLALNAAKAADQGAYSVVVTNAQSSATSAAAAISVVPAAIAPTFSRAPSAQSATAGTDVTFSVVVAGTAPFTYQWLRGGQALAGEIGATLTLRSVQKTNEGAYSVAVSNAGGTASSPAAALTIIGGVTAPTITTQPVAQSAALGGSATFSVVAAGAAPLTYQWTFNGVAITGATGATLPVPTVQSSLYGSYAVVVSNAAGSVVSSSVMLSALASVVPPVFTTQPVITTQPVARTVVAGGGASFGVVATGTAPLTYQWRRDGQVIAGASSATLTLDSIQSAAAGTYTVVVSNASGAVTSAGATLTVSAAPVAPVSRLSNLSVRSLAGAGDQTLIVGFAVGGTGVKSILLRGVGPALAPFGIANALADPQLRLFNSVPVQTHLNDDWGGGANLTAAFSAVGAFALSAASKDAALLIPLGSGVYSAHVTGSGGAVIALLEVYDADAGGTAARLTNLSARTQVGTGDDILVVGFVVSGTAPKTLLLRGVGPGLGAFGVGGVLADPQLKLFNNAGNLVNSNDDWGGGSALATAFTQTGAFALSPASKDAVLLSTLPPGAYTVQISGTDGTRGIALVEVYELP